MKIVFKSVFPLPEEIRKTYSLDPGSTKVLFYYAIRPIELLVRLAKLTIELLRQRKFIKSDIQYERRRSVVEGVLGRAGLPRGH